MQTHGGQAAEDAITAGERRFTHKLLIDWDKDGTFGHPLSDMSDFVVSANINRDLTGGAPEELTLISGAGAAALTVTVAGDHEGQSLVQAFSTYNTNGIFYLQPIHNAEVRYDIIVDTADGPVSYPQFRGFFRASDPDRGEGTVQLEALDRVEVLRRPIRLPQWALIQRYASRGNVRAQLTDSQWVIDHCLRVCDTSPTPYRHTYKSEMGVPVDALDGCHLWVSGTGSWLPTRGWVDNAEAIGFPNTEEGDPEMFALGGDKHPDLAAEDPAPLCLNGMRGQAGPWPFAPDPTELRYWAQDRDLMDYNGTFFLGFTIVTADDWYTNHDLTPIRVGIGQNRDIALHIVDGWVHADYIDDHNSIIESSSQVQIPTGMDFVRVQCQIESTSNNGVTRVWLDAGGNRNAFPETIGDFRASSVDDPLKGLCEVRHDQTLQDIVFSHRNFFTIGDNDAFANVDRPATYAAALDSGRNRFTYMPNNKDGKDAWDVIKEVATAEWGAVHWDESGIFRFWNYDTILAKQDAPVRTVTLNDLKGLSGRNSVDGVRNIFSVTAQQRLGVMDRVFEATDEDEFYVPGESTRIFRVWDLDVIMTFPFKVERHTTSSGSFPQWNADTVNNGYVVQFLIGGVWQEDDSKVDGVDIYSYFNNEGFFVINIQNGYADATRLVTNAGDPALHLRGTRRVENDPQVFQTRYEDSIDQYGERNIPLEGDWYQDQFQSQNMIDTLAVRSTQPVPVADTIPIAGDPRLQLGDAVTVHDPHGFGEAVPAQITGYNRTLDAGGGCSGELTVEFIAPAGWILGSQTYSVLGKTTVLT